MRRGGRALLVDQVDQAAVHGLKESVGAWHLLREVVAQFQFFLRKQALRGRHSRTGGLGTGDSVALNPDTGGVGKPCKSVRCLALRVVAGDLPGALRQTRSFGQLTAVPGLPAIRQRTPKTTEKGVPLHIAGAGNDATQLNEPGGKRRAQGLQGFGSLGEGIQGAGAIALERGHGVFVPGSCGDVKAAHHVVEQGSDRNSRKGFRSERVSRSQLSRPEPSASGTQVWQVPRNS